MEKIRPRTTGVTPYVGYQPFFGIPHERLMGERWQIVCFVSPVCDGTCAHCWSADTFLGRQVPLDWFDSFWSKVNPARVSEIRLTGGEPFLNRDLGAIVRIIRKYLGRKIPIRIFTSGRQIVSATIGQQGVDETISALLSRDVVHQNTEIHMSADEYHAGALYVASLPKPVNNPLELSVGEINQRGVALMQVLAHNFLAACEILSGAAEGFMGRLKIHAENGRLEYHRTEMYHWLSDDEWQKRVIAMEGLIRAGAATKIATSMTLTPNDQLSMFVFPGAEFYEDRITGLGQPYNDRGHQIYLDVSHNANGGVAMIGWWNVIDRTFCAGSIGETLKIVE